MKCKILFSEENKKKDTINFSSAEFANRMVNVNC